MTIRILDTTVILPALHILVFLVAAGVFAVVGILENRRNWAAWGVLLIVAAFVFAGSWSGGD